jgi:hypothetical protein
MRMTRNMVQLRCSKNGGTCNYVTHGRIYNAYPVGSGRVYEISDDYGHTRVVKPGPNCPHIISSYEDRFRSHECVGSWEVP